MKKLISTVEEILEHLPVQMSSEKEVVQPFLDMAVTSHLIPLFGTVQYELLCEAYSEAGNEVEAIGDEKIRTAVRLSQAVIVCLGYYHAVPVLAVKVGNNGIQVFSSDTTKQAFQWQVDDLRKGLLQVGFAKIEALLTHLQANPTKFTSYKDLGRYNPLIPTAALFSQHFNISESRYIYDTISYIMRRVEDQVLIVQFGRPLIDSLRLADLSGKKKELLKYYLQPGIALITAAKALRERVITFDNGVASINLQSNYSSSQRQMAPDRDSLEAAYNQLMEDGQKYLSDGLAFLLENREGFPEFTPPSSSSSRNINNRRDAGLYAT